MLHVRQPRKSVNHENAKKISGLLYPGLEYFGRTSGSLRRQFGVIEVNYLQINLNIHYKYVLSIGEPGRRRVMMCLNQGSIDF
jgi:hypothetical protein